MRVFMLGWEFPPFISGGVGSACYGLTRALSAGGTDVTFVLPRPAAAPFTGEARASTPAVVVAASAGEGEWSAASGSPTPPTLPTLPPSVEFRLDEFQHVTFHAVASGITGPYQRPGGGAGATAPTSKAATFPQGSFGGRGRPGGPGFGSGASATSAAPAPAHVAAAASAATPFGSADPDAEPAEVDLFAEVERYADAVRQVAGRGGFDVVHAHDWMTFAAGAAVAREAGVPLVIHVHSTEADRVAGTAEPADERIAAAEREGVAAADRVIAVSQRTRAALVEQYGADPAKVDVVYNAPGDLPAGDDAGPANPPAGLEPPSPEFVDDLPDDPFAPRPADDEAVTVGPSDKLVAFVGRLTGQKGPDHFLTAAKSVRQRVPDARFVLAGDGDLARPLARRAADLGLADRVVFAGFLCAADVDRLLRAADLFVLPSVSDPFGIAALEAMARDVPTIVSAAAGVSEAVEHATVVDLDQPDALADAIVAALTDPEASRERGRRGGIEVRKMTWSDAACACLKSYAAAGAG